jgi:PAS domain S-box-containing protein
MDPSGLSAGDSATQPRSWLTRLVELRHYGLAVLSVAVALSAALLLDSLNFRDGAVPLLLFAVAISSWYGRTGPSVLAVVLSIGSFYWYFVEPVRTIYIYPSEVPYFIIFVGFAALISWFARVRRRADEALREQADLLNLTHDTVFVMGMDGVIEYWNRGAEERYGWTAGQAVGRVVHDLLKTVLPSPLEEIKAEVTRSGRWEGELLHTKKDGTQIVVASRWALRRNKQGAPAAIMETNNDVTDRKRAEETLERERIRMEVILSALDTGLSLINPDMTIAWVNHKIREMFSAGEPVGQVCHAFYESRETICEGCGTLQAFLSGKVVESEQLVPSVGRWYYIISQPIKDKSGRVVNVLEGITDITERKHAEERLRRLNRELRAISNCNQTLLRATDEQSLLQEICRIACEEAGYCMAWVGYAEHDEAKTVRPVAWTGAEAGYLASAGITWADTERGRAHTGTAIRTGESCCIQDFATDPRVAPWRESLLQRGFRSGIAVPLKDEQGHTFGSLTIHAAQPNAFTPEEIRLLEELAGDMAFGIVNLRSRGLRKQAEEEVTLLSFALNRVNEAALLTDETGRFHYANEEACRVLGYTREELLGMSVADIDIDFPAGRFAEHWRDLSEHRSLSFQSRHRTWDGRIFPVEVSANYFEYGDRAYNLALVRDITERVRAEEKLRQQEQALRQVLDFMPDLVAEFGPNRERLYANRPTLDFFGVTLEEWRSISDPFQFYHPDDWERVRQNIDAQSESAFPRDFEARIQRADGEYRWFFVRENYLRDEEGRIVRRYVSGTDIEDRKRAEQALRLSEEYLAEAQRLSRTGSWSQDVASDTYDYVSEECARIFGFDPQVHTLAGDVVFQRIHPEDRDRVARYVQESIREKVDTSVEYRALLPDGTLKHIHAIRRPVLNSTGDVVRLIGTIVDITERKRAEEAVRLSEERLRLTLEVTQIGAFDWDVAHDVWYASPTYYTALGYEPREGPGDRAEWVDRLHPDDRGRFTRLTHDILTGVTNRYEYEARLRHADGSYRWVQVKALGVEHDPKGKVGRILGVRIDITERKQAEEAQRRLADLLRLSFDAIIVWQLNGAIESWNRGAEHLYGYREHEALGRVSHELLQTVHPVPWPEIEARLRESGTWEGELRHTTKEGQEVTVFTRHQLIVDADGFERVLETNRDITDRKRAEEMLRRSEGELRQLVDVIPQQVFVFDADWNPVFANRRELDYTGLTVQEMRSTDAVARIFHPEDLQKLEVARRRARSDAAPFEMEARIRGKDGGYRWFLIRDNPLCDVQGNVLRWYGTRTDIEERKRAEEALREGETRFRTFVDHAGDALFVYDLEHGTIVDVNRSACESLGYTRQELIGKTPAAFHLDSHREELESTAERAAAGETVFDSHLHRRKDGSTFPVEVHTSLVSYGGRRFLLKVARDITDRVRAEEQRERLRQLEAELAHINRVSILGELTASIAHEINQPLSGVVSNGSACLRWLAGDAPNIEEARETARRIVRDGKRAAEIIVRIRALTKRTAVSGERIDIDEPIREVLQLVGDEAKRMSVTIRTRLAGDAFPVLGDRVQLQQVLLNLVMNGIEAMSTVEDRPRQLTIASRNTDRGEVEVTVEDSGTGLDPDASARIFDAFYTTKPGGMGMGLSISRSILQAHGGRLWATGKETPGTVFHFTLPKEQDRANAEAGGV